MPVEVLPRAARGGGESRLSSFGFSGTIAHGAFDVERCAAFSYGAKDCWSLYRRRRLLALNDASRLRLGHLASASKARQIGCRSEDATRASTGTLAPSAMVLFSRHVVNNSIVLPGVGYVEMAFSAE